MDFSSFSIPQLREFLSSQPVLDLLHLVEMMDAGNMHGFDFSNDPDSVALAKDAAAAFFELAGRQIDKGEISEARRSVMNTLDLCFYIFPEDEDPRWMELLSIIESKIR